MESQVQLPLRPGGQRQAGEGLDSSQGAGLRPRVWGPRPSPAPARGLRVFWPDTRTQHIYLPDAWQTGLARAPCTAVVASSWYLGHFEPPPSSWRDKPRSSTCPCYAPWLPSALRIESRFLITSLRPERPW